ncbi:MAG: ABC-type transport auxiliary lipoprotein family protein [Hyphomicrobiaceae bacterium]
MEVNARYVLMGVFALAVIGLGFGFVYWLEVGTGLGARMAYAIRYDGQVAGLLRGSAVLFNGVRVGEVTGLSLDARKPGEVLVTISVEPRTPVRADTRVGIDFEGLTGSPVVALSGGTASLPLFSMDPSRPVPILVAEPNAGQSMTQAAREVLRGLDRVIADNAAPLKSAVASIETFAGALARNSDKVDRIMAGLDRLTGGTTKPAAQVFDLRPATSFPPIASVPKGLLQIPEPTMLAHLETDKIVLSGGGGPRLEGTQWPDVLPRVMQSALLRSFENAGYRRVIGRAPEGAKPDNQLIVDVRRFQIATGAAPVAEVEIGARIATGEGAVSEVHVFTARTPVATLEPGPATEALNEAFGKAAAEMVAWTCANL